MESLKNVKKLIDRVKNNITSVDAKISQCQYSSITGHFQAGPHINLPNNHPRQQRQSVCMRKAKLYNNLVRQKSNSNKDEGLAWLD